MFVTIEAMNTIRILEIDEENNNFLRFTSTVK